MQPFSILLAVGSLAGLLMAIWRAPKKEISRYLDAGIWVLFGALLVSRAVAVAANWSYYHSHLLEIFQVWLGGLSAIGALAGGLVAVICLAVLWKLPAGRLADTLLPLAGTLAIAGWLGCWLSGVSYGSPSNAWWAVPTRDEWGVLAQRVPVQLIGAVLTLVFIWLLDQFSHRLPMPGVSASIGLFGLSGIIFVLSFIRADPSLLWYGVRPEAWGSIILMAVSIVAVVVLLVRWKSRTQVNHRG
jgi:prolipoprotein diacylglyceryltransferase